MDENDEIYIQTLEPEKIIGGTTILSTIGIFLSTQIVLCPLYLWWFILVFFAQWGSIQTTKVNYLEFYFCLLLANGPIMGATYGIYQFFCKKDFLWFHPLVFRWTAGIWMTILLIFSYAMMIPNNIIATTIDKVQRESQYQQQMNLTGENFPKIQGVEPFFVSYGEYGEVISLYSVDFVPYLELTDESHNYAVITFEKVNQYVKDEEHQVEFSKNISNSTTLDRIFLVKQDGHSEFLLYTNKFGSEMLFRVVGQDDFYHIENKTISLEPSTFTDERFGNNAFYLSTIYKNLKSAIPVNPLDPETVTYAHIPYYTLKPTNTYPFPWLEFSIENRPLVPHYPSYTIGEKSADKDGNNYLSTTKPVDDSEVMYASLYNTSDRAFINHGADCYYFYLTALVDEQVRVSNAVMMTKEQYLRGSW